MEEVGKILPRVLKKHVRGERAPVLEVLMGLWPRVAGKAMADEARPAAFKAGTLTLVTSSESWAGQLHGLREEIRTAVNRTLGQPLVKELQVRLVPGPCSQPTVPGTKSPALRLEVPAALPGWSETETGAETGVEIGPLTGLDPETRRVLSRCVAKYFARETGVNGWP